MAKSKVGIMSKNIATDRSVKAALGDAGRALSTSASTQEASNDGQVQMMRTTSDRIARTIVQQQGIQANVAGDERYPCWAISEANVQWFTSKFRPKVDGAIAHLLGVLP